MKVFNNPPDVRAAADHWNQANPLERGAIAAAAGVHQRACPDPFRVLGADSQLRIANVVASICKIHALDIDQGFTFTDSVAVLYYYGNGWHGRVYSGGPWHIDPDTLVIPRNETEDRQKAYAEIDARCGFSNLAPNQ